MSTDTGQIRVVPVSDVQLTITDEYVCWNCHVIDINNNYYYYYILLMCSYATAQSLDNCRQLLDVRVIVN